MLNRFEKKTVLMLKSNDTKMYDSFQKSLPK